MKISKCAFLVIISLFLLGSAFAIPWPVDPQNTAHATNKTYGDWNSFTVDTISCLGYHGGVDIPADSGTPVLAVIDGVVSNYRRGTGSDTGFINIAVDDNSSLAWSYQHILLHDTLVQNGDSVYIGDTLGYVARFLGFDDNDHLHFQRSNNDYDELTGYLNPLNSLSLSPSQTPFILDRPPGVPHHPKQIFYVEDKSEDTTGYCYETSYLRDSVDIIVFALTTIEGNSDNGIYSIGYGVNPVEHGDSIPFRKMFEMRDTIKVSDSLQYYLTYADSLCAHFYNFYIVTNCSTNAPQPGYGLSNIKEDCWPTKINTAGTANADSIEDAKFPDGYYVTTIKVWSHSGDSAVALDTILVDNFNPRVKEIRPNDWFAFVPTHEKRVWCRFSEQMDTTTFNSTNIKIRSLKADSFNYPILNFIYEDSTYKLTLEVDSFRFKDTVQVKLLDGVKDLAGKSIDTTGSRQTIAYSWTFVVGVIQLTDNNLNDIQPDLYHDNIVWTQAPADSYLGEIILYNFYNKTTDTISPGGGIHNSPYIYKDKVVWFGYGWESANPVYYYDGATTQQIAPANRGRYSMEISEGGVVWRAYWYAGGEYDTIWVEYYEPVADTLYTLDVFRDWYGRYCGRADIDLSKVVWDRCNDDWIHDIYYYDGVVQNFSNDPDSNDWTPDICNGQIAWIKEWANGGYGYLWFYDGSSKRKLQITQGPAYAPQLHNGSIVWLDEPSSYLWRLAFFDGREAHILMQRPAGYWNQPFPYSCIHNNQVAFLRMVYDTYPPLVEYYNASFFDGEQVIHLTVDTLGSGHTNRIEVHDGFVVYDAWDGNDYEIYLYIGDTLFTPPAVVQNLRNDIIEADASDKQVKLIWSPNSESDLAGYKIYRSDTSYQYDTIPYDSVLGTDTIFTDTIPLDGYNHYVVTAFDNANNEGGFSNQTEAFIDVFPPSAPYVDPAEKSGNDVVLTWNKITTDTLGNSELMHYYVVYRNTSPSFIPGPSDSIGYASHPDTVFTDTDALTSSNSYYYLVKAVDWARNQSKKSNMGYKLNKFFNENISASNRNWVSLPWHSGYTTVSDLTDDLSSSGDPLEKIVNLRDDQMYVNWIWDPDFLVWYGDDFAITPGRGYEMVTINDTSLFLVGSNNPAGLISLEENPTATNRNWVSIPYNAAYSTAGDITTEYSPSGDPLEKIVNLRDDQMYVNWIWDPDFLVWYGDDFAITPGRGYEMVTIIDTTWNPTEYINESGMMLLAGSRNEKSDLDVHLGKSTESDRAPVWSLKEDIDQKPATLESKFVLKKEINYLDADVYEPVIEKSKLESKKKIDYLDADIYKSISNKCDCKDLGNRNDYRVAGISHIVRAHLRLKDFENLVFTVYRPDRPYDVLTEDVVGSGIAKKDSRGAIWFDVGNFKRPWQYGEEVILIIEASKQGRGYFTVLNFKLDKGVDIQDLGEITLALMPEPKSVSKNSLARWDKVSNDNIVGYSVYQGDRRLNEQVIEKREYSKAGNISLKPVIKGGYETVYSSNITTTEERALIPLQFSFGSISPNPFTKHTEMKYVLPTQVKVDIVIFDIIGRKVRTLVSERQEPGYYSTVWNGTDDKGRKVSSGIYFIRFEAGEFRSQNKILLVK